MGTKILDEDGLLDLIRTKPGKKSKYEIAAEAEVGSYVFIICLQIPTNITFSFIFLIEGFLKSLIRCIVNVPYVQVKI